MSTLTLTTTQHDDDDLKDEEFVPPVRTPAEIRSSAFHEAGHAVAYWLARYPVVLATIKPGREDTRLGITGFVARVPSYITPWDRSFTLAAGPIAQAMLGLRDQEREDVMPGPEHDLDHFLGRAFLGGGRSDLRRDMDAMGFAVNADLSEAVRMRLEAHWPGVEAVAGALITHGTLTGTELYELLDELHA